MCPWGLLRGPQRIHASRYGIYKLILKGVQITQINCLLTDNFPDEIHIDINLDTDDMPYFDETSVIPKRVTAANQVMFPLFYWIMVFRA